MWTQDDPAPASYDLGQIRALAQARFGALLLDVNEVREGATKIRVYCTDVPNGAKQTAWTSDLASYAMSHPTADELAATQSTRQQALDTGNALLLRRPGTPPTPDTGYAAFYVDAAGLPKILTDTGSVLDLKGPKGDTGLTGPKGDQGIQGLTGPQGLPGVNATVSTVATALLDGLMPAADKAKLDAYPTVLAPVGIVTAVTAGNSAADTAIATLSVPLGKLAAGQQFAAAVDALVGNGTTAGTLNFWVKVAGTKILTAAVTTTTTAKTNQPARFDARLTVRTAGPTTGTVVAGGLLVSTSPAATLVLPVSSGASAVSVSTLALVDIVVGFNWTAANASNTATAIAASLAQVK